MVSKYFFPLSGPQGSSEKRLIPGLRQGTYKMSLGHLVAPESQKDTEASLRGLPLAKSGTT